MQTLGDMAEDNNNGKKPPKMKKDNLIFFPFHKIKDSKVQAEVMSPKSKVMSIKVVTEKKTTSIFKKIKSLASKKSK